MTEMQALIKEKGGVALRLTSLPPCDEPHSVLIRVHTAGICRTDLAVMRHQLSTPEPLITGHEFAGTVVAMGAAVKSLKLGQRVTAMPLLPCFTCFACLSNQPETCLQGKMLGLHVSGAFAEYVALPHSLVFPLSDQISWKMAAFTEPVAAAGAIFKAAIEKHQRGAILGAGRISELSLRLLRSQGFGHVVQADNASELAENSCDWLIETGLASTDLDTLFQALKPGGLLLLKSRHLPQLVFNPRELIRKEIRIQGVYYAPFSWALDWLEKNASLVNDLLGEVYPAHNWERAVKVAEAGESQKIFLSWS
jgi:threonine dehydrogenase-like Zn-dependent dehydrogenase